MRELGEIQRDLSDALERLDAASIDHYAVELAGLKTRYAEAESTRCFAVSARERGEIARSLDLFDNAMEIFEELGDTLGRARALYGKGLALVKAGDFRLAIENFLQAIELNRQLNRPADVAFALHSIGVAYGNLQECDKGIEYIRRAMDVFDAQGKRDRVASTLNDLGVMFEYVGDYPTAIEYYQRAHDLHLECGNLRAATMNLSNIAAAWHRYGDSERAVELYRRALITIEELGFPRGLMSLVGSLGSALEAIGQANEAIEHFQRATVLAREQGDTPAVVFFLGNLASRFISDGDVDKAQQILDEQQVLGMTEPRTVIAYQINRSFIAEKNANLAEANRELQPAYELATTLRLTPELLRLNERSRHLARAAGDFDAYVAHNDACLTLAETIRGRQTAQRMSAIESERRIEQERQERDKERAVLFSALPQHVAERMIRGEKVTSDHFTDAAVLFVDIVGFTSHTRDLPPSEVIGFLELVFSTFDECCRQYGVLKVKTIGDSYMCFKGDGTAHENAAAMAAVALSMLQKEFRWPSTSDRVAFRIGIHVGPASAGVIGTERLQYDVWGDTVNVASRMESAGEPGRIHVSEAFVAMLTSPHSHLDHSNTSPHSHLDHSNTSPPNPLDHSSTSPPSHLDHSNTSPPNHLDHSNTSPPNPLSSLRGGTSLTPLELERGGAEGAGVRYQANGGAEVRFQITLRGETELKGKGLMTTYWLEGPIT